MRLSQVVVLVLIAAVGQSVGQAEVNDPVRPAWILSLDNDRVTVHLDQVPLRDVLAELARQATLRLTIDESAGSEHVSASFHDVPLDQAIDRLLGTRSYALVYAPTASGPSTREPKWISELIVLSGTDLPADREEPRQAEPTQAEGLGHPDPQVRITALEQWAQHREGDSVDPLSHALVDPDEQVRTRAQELWEQALARQAETAAVR